MEDKTQDTATVVKNPPKWSTKEIATLTDGYDGSPESVTALMAELGRTRRSVVGKLVNLPDVEYVAPVKPKAAAKVDEGPTKKERIAVLRDSGFINADGLLGASKDAITEVAALRDITF